MEPGNYLWLCAIDPSTFKLSFIPLMSSLLSFPTFISMVTPIVTPMYTSSVPLALLSLCYTCCQNPTLVKSCFLLTLCLHSEVVEKHWPQ